MGYDNLFEDYQDSLQAETFVQSSSSSKNSNLLPASEYVNQKLNENRNIFEEMEEENVSEEEEEDQFEDAEDADNQEKEDTEVSSPPEIITSEDVKNATPPEETKNEVQEESEEDQDDDDDEDDEDIDLEAEMEKLGVDDEDLGSDIDTSE